MSDQKEMKRRLKALMLKPENQVCSDCPERQPRWASLIVPPPGSPPGSTKIGAFCCLECSGSHRRLGVHISFVRSVNLDSWKESEVLAMENGGNKKVNAIWEANLQRAGGRKPVTGADLNTRERYIRDKYERRKFYDHQALIDYQKSEPSFDDIGSKNQGGDFANFGPPADSQVSDAARLRAERKKKKTVDRKKSLDDPAKQRRAKKQEAHAPPPTQTQAEVDLLDLGGGGGGGRDSKPSTNGQASAAPAPFADFFSMEATAPAPSLASQPAPTMEPPRRKGSRDGPSRSRSSNRDSNTPDQDTTRENQQQDILSMYNMQNSSNSSNNGMMNPMAGFNNQPSMMAMMQQMQNMNFNNANSNPQQQQQQYNMGTGQQQMQPQAQQQPFNMQQMQRMMQQMQFNPQMMQAMMQTNAGSPNYNNNNNKQMNPNMMVDPNMNMNVNPNMMMGFNPNMMQQPNSNNNMMMMNNQFGGMNPMGGQSNGTSNSNNNNNANQVPEKEDPFAQFGMNAFR